MTVSAIRQQLYDYIRVAEDRKIKAIYTMLEEEIAELYDHWNDAKFTSQLEERTEDYKSGKVKGVAWETAQNTILQSNKETKLFVSRCDKSGAIFAPLNSYLHQKINS